MAKTNGGRSNAWIWTIIRELIALILGLYLLIGANSSAPLVVGYALAGYLTIAGLMQSGSSLFNRKAPGSGIDRVRGLTGLIGGGVLVLLTYFEVAMPVLASAVMVPTSSPGL